MVIYPEFNNCWAQNIPTCAGQYDKTAGERAEDRQGEDGGDYPQVRGDPEKPPWCPIVMRAESIFSLILLNKQEKLAYIRNKV